MAMNKEFLKEHFIDEGSMEDYQTTLNEASELQSRINNGDFNLFDNSEELFESYEQLSCVARILFLAIFNAKNEAKDDE